MRVGLMCIVLLDSALRITLTARSCKVPQGIFRITTRRHHTPAGLQRFAAESRLMALSRVPEV
jgi:hypothetical protein